MHLPSVKTSLVRLVAAISSRIPYGFAGALNRPLSRFRRISTPIQARRWGCFFELLPSEYIDFGVLFFPKYYDRVELKHLRKILEPGDTFVDVGANIGIYSALSSRLVGNSGQVIAIEANPETFQRLSAMVSSNNLSNVRLHEKGVAAQESDLEFWVNTSGNAGGSTFARRDSEKSLYGRSQVIHCVPLSTLTPDRIRLMKLDIEGLEAAVLEQFFQDGGARPDYVLIEELPGRETTGISLELLNSHGYNLIWSEQINYLFEYSHLNGPVALDPS